MSKTINGERYKLACKFRECFGKHIALHSTKGKPEHSLKDAYFPFALAKLRSNYVYFDLLTKDFDSLSDVQKQVYLRRKNALVESIYPAYESSGLSMDAFVSQKLSKVLSYLEKDYGVYKYDDTLCHTNLETDSKVYPDWIRIGKFYEQLVLSSIFLNADKRYKLFFAMCRGDYDLMQDYIDVWNCKDYQNILEHQLVICKNSYSGSSFDFAKQQFDYYSKIFKESLCQ